MSIGPPSQKLWPNLMFGRFPHHNYKVKFQSGGRSQYVGLKRWKSFCRFIDNIFTPALQEKRKINNITNNLQQKNMTVVRQNICKKENGHFVLQLAKTWLIEWLIGIVQVFTKKRYRRQSIVTTTCRQQAKGNFFMCNNLQKKTESAVNGDLGWQLVKTLPIFLLNKFSSVS